MRRTRYLVCYDIRDPRRLRRVARACESYGYRIQYSVFECGLDRMRFEQLKAAIDSEIKHNEDQVLFVSLGEPASHETVCIEALGIPYRLPTRVTVI